MEGQKYNILSGRVAVFLCASAGELDVVLPLLKIDEIDDFRLVSFRKEISSRIQEDSFYGRLLVDRLEDRAVPKLPKSKIRRWWIFLRNSVGTVREYRKFDFYCFEYGHAGREKNILILLLTLLGYAARIIYYPHGHAVTPESAYEDRRRPRATRISSWFGSRILKLDGVAAGAGLIPARYPILHPSWKAFLKQNVRPIYDNHVVILSRAAHPSYLLEDNRRRMFDEVLALFREHYPDARVVIKAHPRESISSEEFSNRGQTVDVTYDNTYLVLKNARVAVSFWTSAFFQCIALDVPVAEYHLAHEKFRRLYPNGSLNQPFLPCFSDPAELEGFFLSQSRRDDVVDE